MVKYWKDSLVVNGEIRGKFHIYVNNQLISFNNEVNENWMLFAMPLPDGLNKIKIVYNAKVTDSVSYISAKIEYIEIKGTGLASLSCEECKRGTSVGGNGHCVDCQPQFYFDLPSKTCKSCPPNDLSPKGSVGIESCQSSHLCTSSDYSAYFTPCNNNKTREYYEWNYPLNCANQYIQLPIAN